MSIEDEVKTKDAKAIVRFLAASGNYGKKFTPYGIAKELAAPESKMYNQKVERILGMLTIRFPDVFGYEALSNYSYYWIQAEKGSFQEWFKDWFGEKF